MTAISPSDIEGQQANQFYESDEAYLYAIADAMRQEYKAIVDAGMILQIDDPRLLTYYISQPELTVEECRAWAELRVDVLNHALHGLPEDRIRFHTCYGINIGPRVHEMNLIDIADIMLKINVEAYLFEAGNPRHEHEWKVWEDVALPEGKIIIPGVISHSTPLVERLRVRDLRSDRAGDPSQHCLGQIRQPRRRSPTGIDPVVVKALSHCFCLIVSVARPRTPSSIPNTHA